MYEMALQLAYEKKQAEKAEIEHIKYRAKVMNEDYEVTRNVNAVLKRAREADKAITKTIQESKALIAKYYKWIGDFDDHMISIRNREVRRIIMEGTEEEKAQTNSLFPGQKGEPKSKLHQCYLLKAKAKQDV